MTTAYSGYGIPTPDSTDLNHTAHRIRYKHNIDEEVCSVFKTSVLGDEGKLSFFIYKKIIVLFLSF
jgi:hypothetical protein